MKRADWHEIALNIKVDPLEYYNPNATLLTDAACQQELKERVSNMLDKFVETMEYYSSLTCTEVDKKKREVTFKWTPVVEKDLGNKATNVLDEYYGRIKQ